MPTATDRALQDPPAGIESWLDSARDPGASLRSCLARVRRDSPQGVWISVISDETLERHVAALERHRADLGDEASLRARYPLFGVPYAVKDNIDVAGFPTTVACPAYARQAEASAEVVERLARAGAVCIGKTNLDQFATGLVGTRSPYGQPSCVFSDDHISGGSSSGSAVAVALGLVPFALGTDTAGSGRVPAAFNGIVGLKPTPGRVSTRGVVPACRSLDCVSVFAGTVGDAARVLACIEGDDPADPFSRFAPGPSGWPGVPDRMALRVGVPAAPQFLSGSGYAGPWREALRHLDALGHRAVPLDFSLLSDVAALLYAGPWVAERYLAAGGLLKTHPEALDPIVREVISAGGRFSAADSFRAGYELAAMRRRANALWRDVDVLMVPSAPGHPRFDDVRGDPIGVNSALGTYTNFVNLLSWSALAVPAGSAEGGRLPFGVTFIAPESFDAALAGLGAAWQESRASRTAGRSGRGSAALPIPPASEPVLAIAVVGAHLSGMPLNPQLVERGARLACVTATAPQYRLYALPGTRPPKPGLLRVARDGAAISVEVWEMPAKAVGSFLELVPAPLALGKIELADGRWVTGFVCEAQAVAGAEDISRHGGWRAYQQSIDGRALRDASATKSEPTQPHDRSLR